MSPLTPEQRVAAMKRRDAYVRRQQLDSDLLAELEERARSIALLQVDLDDCTDDEHRQIIGRALVYEASELQDRQAELERRQRAKRYGYRDSRPGHDRLPARFAAMRQRGPEFFAMIASRITGTEIKRSGERYLLSCPWHSDSDPSLSIYPRGNGICFSCGWTGDVAGFVALITGCSMTEALVMLEEGVV